MKKAKMPWAAVPFQAKSGEAIAEKYNVTGIPKLLVLGKDGKLLTSEGRNLVNLQTLLDK
jgi:nucleoredoxin